MSSRSVDFQVFQSGTMLYKECYSNNNWNINFNGFRYHLDINQTLCHGEVLYVLDSSF